MYICTTFLRQTNTSWHFLFLPSFLPHFNFSDGKRVIWLSDICIHRLESTHADWCFGWASGKFLPADSRCSPGISVCGSSTALSCFSPGKVVWHSSSFFPWVCRGPFSLTTNQPTALLCGQLVHPSLHACSTQFQLISSSVLGLPNHYKEDWEGREIFPFLSYSPTPIQEREKNNSQWVGGYCPRVPHPFQTRHIWS